MHGTIGIFLYLLRLYRISCVNNIERYFRTQKPTFTRGNAIMLKMRPTAFRGQFVVGPRSTWIIHRVLFSALHRKSRFSSRCPHLVNVSGNLLLRVGVQLLIISPAGSHSDETDFFLWIGAGVNAGRFPLR